MIKFRDNSHEENFYNILSRMRRNDPYHRSAAYLMALVPMCPEDVFSFETDCVIFHGLYAGLQSSSSRRATRLMHNLWNGTYMDRTADEPAKTACYYAIDNIMDNHEYFPWFVEAIRIRFEWDEFDD